MLNGMELRHSAMPERPDPAPDQDPVLEQPTPTEVRYRVDRRLTAVRVAGAVVFAAVALVRPDPLPRVFALLAAAVLVGYAVRDLAVPVRLTADAEGVDVVTGFAGRRRIPWSEVERVRLDKRSRLGMRSELLEVDTGEQLYLFSSYDLGTPCWEAARTLAAIRGQAGAPTDR
jgi:hypothetical protein